RLVDDEARPDVAHPRIVEFGVDHGDRVADPLAEVALGMLGLSAGDDDRHRGEFAGGARDGGPGGARGLGLWLRVAERVASRRERHPDAEPEAEAARDRKSTRLNSSHVSISYS